MPAQSEMLIKSKKKKRVRAVKLLIVFAGLAFTNLSKKYDKLITPTVRVRHSIVYLSLIHRTDKPADLYQSTNPA